MKKAAWSRAPLQDGVVSFGLGKEISHLQSCRPSPEHAVIKVAGDIVAVVIVKGAMDTANQDGKDETLEV